jgi:hypothetical protein
MRTWSVESLFVKAYSFGAVCVQGVLDAVGTIEQVTRPPRLGHDLDVVDGAEQLAERDTHLNGLADFFLGLGCGRDMESYAEGFNEGFAEAQRQEREHPNEYEPGLDDSELVAVRRLLEERYGRAL